MKKFGKFIRKHKFLTALVILLIVGAVVFLCLPKAEVTYSEEKVTRRDIVTYNSFVGNIQPASETSVTVRASDFVKAVYFKEGDTVKAGDLLAELDTETLDYNIQKAEENFAISRWKFDYDFDNALTSEQEDLLLNTTGESLKISEQELEHLKDSRKNYQIYAPADGVLTYWNLTEGAVVSTGMTVAKISDLSNLQISIRIDEYSILDAKEGLPVTIYVDATGKTYEGTLSKIAKTATVQGGVSYFNATVEFVADEDAHSGISAEVRLIKTNRLQVLTVSSSALQYHEDNTAFVLIRNEEGKVVEQSVTLGASDGKYVEILSGLSLDETILYTPKVEYPMAFMMSRGNN